MTSEPKRLRESENDLGRLLNAASQVEAPASSRQRNWARVSEVMHSRTGRWLPLALAMSSAALVALVAWVGTFQPKPLPAVASIQVMGPVHVGDPLAAERTVVTEPAGQAVLEIPSASAVLLEASTLSVRRVGTQGVALKLAQGTVVIESDKREVGTELTVDALGHRVTVVGTLFSVEIHEQQLTVRCARGTVRVSGPGIDVLLPAPQTWSSQGSLPTSLTPQQVEYVSSVRRSHELRPWPIEKQNTETVSQTREEERSVPVALPKNRVSDDDARGLALYSDARAKLKHGEVQKAISLFSEYKELFPQGPLVQEVSLSLVEALLVGHSYSDAVSEADAFLKAFPSSERRSELLLVKANVLKEWGDYSGAMALYDELQHSKSQQAESALYFLGVCQGRTHAIAQARASFRKYLSLYPTGRFVRDAKESLKNLK